ncbi:MAG: FecR domain-containing protein [Sedimentisphaerales bacterium]|nr:FecR domain-containing protein [Sedimentisphaerales bacterium]
MSSESKDIIELRALLALVLEGTAQEPDIARLNELLKSNVEMQQYYLDYVDVCQGLGDLKEYEDVEELGRQYTMICGREFWEDLARSEGENPAVEVEGEVVPVETRPVRAKVITGKLGLMLAISSMAAMLLMVFHFMFLQTRPPVAVGCLAGSIDASWVGHDGDLATGADIITGVPLELKKGLARILLFNGSSVVVNSPAQLCFDSSSSLYLQRGKIAIIAGKLPEGVFTVRTDSCTVVDYGTEFGVSAGLSGGKTETQVLSGRVEVQATGIKSRMMLYGGQAAQAQLGSEVKPARFDRMAFVFSDEYQARENAAGGSGYDRWKAYGYQLQRDPSLVASYFHVRDIDSPERLVNSAPLTEGTLDGVFGDTARANPEWVQGRWPGKDAVKFERGKNQSILIPASEKLTLLNPFTVSFWLYIPEGDRYGGHVVSCRKKGVVYYQVSLFDSEYSIKSQKRRFEFLQFRTEDPQRVYGKEFMPEKSSWYNITVVYDGGQALFYVNGQLWDKLACEGLSKQGAESAELVIGSAKIGLTGLYTGPDGDLNGVLDELLIFNRCLAEEEIEQIYASGKP